LTPADNGTHVATSANVTIQNTTTFASGQNFVIYNNSAVAITIASSGTQVLRFAGSTITGTRTLAPYGVATILCVTGGIAASVFVITGAGLV
jgi:hypothetical protein